MRKKDFMDAAKKLQNSKKGFNNVVDSVIKLLPSDDETLDKEGIICNLEKRGEGLVNCIKLIREAYNLPEQEPRDVPGQTTFKLDKNKKPQAEPAVT